MDEQLWLEIEAALHDIVTDPEERREAVNAMEALFEAKATHYECAINNLGGLVEDMEAKWRDSDQKLQALHRSLALKAGAGA